MEKDTTNLALLKMAHEEKLLHVGSIRKIVLGWSALLAGGLISILYVLGILNQVYDLLALLAAPLLISFLARRAIFQVKISNRQITELEKRQTDLKAALGLISPTEEVTTPDTAPEEIDTYDWEESPSFDQMLESDREAATMTVSKWILTSFYIAGILAFFSVCIKTIIVYSSIYG